MHDLIAPRTCRAESLLCSEARHKRRGPCSTLPVRSGPDSTITAPVRQLTIAAKVSLTVANDVFRALLHEVGDLVDAQGLAMHQLVKWGAVNP